MDIKSIRQAIKDDKPVEYTAHCQKRMLERDIARADIINCIFNGEIIEDYPLEEGNSSENSFPCCLILDQKVKEDRTRWNSDHRTRLTFVRAFCLSGSS
jgi:hypothetical protein